MNQYFPLSNPGHHFINKELQKFVNTEAQNQNTKSNLNTNTIYNINWYLKKKTLWECYEF